MVEKQNTAPGSEKQGAMHVVWGIAVALAFVLIFGLVVRFLWNWLMPAIFGLKTISYLQGIGLMLLSRILFGRVGQRRDHAGYLTGKYGFRSLIGRGRAQENAANDARRD
jgi:hypothetical protein